MTHSILNMAEVSQLLKKGYPQINDPIWEKLPFADLHNRVWNNDKHYQTHGPKVLKAMNILLSNQPEKLFERINGKRDLARFRNEIDKMRITIFGNWDEDEFSCFMRLTALYHDIGKCIIRERHPTIGWYIVKYMNTKEKHKLQSLLKSEHLFRLFMIVLRDHDQFGTLSTGEASYPILLRTIESASTSIETQKEALTALLLCNLADIAGTISLQMDTVDTIFEDWKWLLRALDHCAEKKMDVSTYIINKASELKHVLERIRRLLVVSSYSLSERRKELDDKQYINDRLHTIFGSKKVISEFSCQFTHVCKLDYGKRFFDMLIEYCEGPPTSASTDPQSEVALWKNARLDKEHLIYSVLAVLKRICRTYGAMIGTTQGPGNLIGVEMKDLTPDNAPEKTAQIIELLTTSHYPALAWMMSDVPAWYF